MNYAKRFLKTLLLLQILLFHSCSSLDTITVDQPIKDGDVLTSNGDIFELGFFTPGKSTNRYVGIWYKFSNQTIIWVANRDRPVNDSSGILSINPQGNLVLSQNDVALWSTNVSFSSPNNSAVVQLSNSGNLVLLGQGNKRLLWQSSDHLTDVLLTEVKLGLNRKTGLNRYITSWVSEDDPRVGNSLLRMEPEGSPQLFLYKDSAKLWRSGHWNGNQWSGIPAMHRNNIFDVVFVNNQDEITVKWTVLDPSILTFVKIEGSGSIEQFTWQQQQRKWIEIYSAPVDPCDYYGKCGAFGSCNPFDVSGYECDCLPGYEPKSPNDWALRDGSQGCRKKQGISMCRNGEGFVKVGDIKLPDTSNVHVDMSLSLEECREECLRNCSCLAFANADVRDGGSGCLAWHGSLVDIKQFTEGGQDLFVRVDKHELAKYSEKSKGLPTKWMIVILVASIAVASLIIGSVLYLFRRRKRKGKGQSAQLNDFAASSQGFDKCQSKGEVDDCRGNTDTTFFYLSTIIAATNNFLSSNKLGQGGFGSVYKGTLADGQEIAVKRLSRNSGQGIEEFKNEVKLIAKLQHRNLVRLLGCCIHQEEKMLIYEYMPNKSLDLFIFDQNRKSMLDWRRRFQIIFGIARGVLYLHQDSRLKIIHRDLKASNVLLDATMNPKISDFGMARMFGDDQVEANTNRIVGT
nr:G-type lectin S-receptor-like serine/threonine-protein kinase RKS1 isoform X2 [Ziziphus jujuba var. spinosa]